MSEVALDCGGGGLAVEVDESMCIVLVSRDLRGDVRAIYTVTNVRRMHEALDEAVALRNARKDAYAGGAA